MDDADLRATVRWNDPGFGEPVVGTAMPAPVMAASCWDRIRRRNSIRLR